MNLQFDIVELDQDALLLAWPLVRTSSSYSQFERWQESAENLIDRGGKVLAVTALDGALHGVATYEAVEQAHFGRILQVDTFVTFELNGSAPVRSALMTQLRWASKVLDCSGMIISASRRPHWNDRPRKSSANPLARAKVGVPKAENRLRRRSRRW